MADCTPVVWHLSVNILLANPHSHENSIFSLSFVACTFVHYPLHEKVPPHFLGLYVTLSLCTHLFTTHYYPTTLYLTYKGRLAALALHTHTFFCLPAMLPLSACLRHAFLLINYTYKSTQHSILLGYFCENILLPGMGYHSSSNSCTVDVSLPTYQVLEITSSFGLTCCALLPPFVGKHA